MKFGPQHYWAPTPKKIRKIADAILAGVVFAGSTASLNGHPIVGTVIFSLGVIAKIVSNFFTEENEIK
jgi:asparagine N-glycosylation enzyme membrane subunit Stt3